MSDDDVMKLRILYLAWKSVAAKLPNYKKAAARGAIVGIAACAFQLEDVLRELGVEV